MEYNAKDIETLSFRDAVRERVAMYMGSADNQGVLQCVREIITNSIDEATMGFGNCIIVEFTHTKSHTAGRAVTIILSKQGIKTRSFVHKHTSGKLLGIHGLGTINYNIV